MKWITIACAALCIALPRQSLGDARQAVLSAESPIGTVVPLVVGGSLTGTPPDSPALHVDPNTASSPFAGVGSVFIDADPVGDGQGFICSGCAIHGFTLGKQVVRNYVLMAAHCLDFAGGITPQSTQTGDGIPDVLPQNVNFILNAGGDFTSFISATEIHLHPNWHGFLNTLGPEGASVNDDVALLRLSSPVPLGVPTYNLATSFSGFVEKIQPTGYGASGSAQGYSVGASFSVKRTGFNLGDQVLFDDEGTSAIEVFQADFDGPDGTTNVFDVGQPGFDPSIEGTLGNKFESATGPGDSGSPSFLDNYDSGALELGSDGRPIVYGINTFGSSNSPSYGSIFGGTLVARYASWIDSVIAPEPTSLAMALLGLFALPASRVARRRHSR